MIGLGDYVRDQATGFHGRATALCSILEGSTTVQVERTNHAVDALVSLWFEEARLEVIPPPAQVSDDAPSGIPA